ncbi:PREDICTED: adrenodoxin, mitochondrial-like [Gekko japonicus]|uniref:Adrenodoxin, mitochondrial-like n=1 Tax=Gekko japonicus TaxID=146911 RepID=A0ABM1KTR9_GEKJA|nr:PREDICTED: adrenodoxin, mitochondrial-like [Gekko japonicus]
MLPQGFSGIARPLLSRAAGQRAAWALGGFFGRAVGSPAPASPHPGRGFRGTPRLQDAPGDTGSADRVTINFINRDGEKFSATAKEGESLLEVVVNQNLSIDGFGACEGALACSTCHLIFDDRAFQQLDPVTPEELDMLDLAYGLTDTSRLGCQVRVKKWMDGLTAQVPVEVSDIRKELEVEKQSKQ